MAEQPLLPDKLSSWVKLGLLVALPAYLLFDLAMANIHAGYHQREVDRRHDLCLVPVDETGTVVEDLEEQRRSDQPVSLLGKLHLFMTCAEMTKLGALGSELKVADATRLATVVRRVDQAREQLRLLELTEELRRASLQEAQGKAGPIPFEETELDVLIGNLGDRLQNQITRQEELIARIEDTGLSEAAKSGAWYLVTASFTQVSSANAAVVELEARRAVGAYAESTGVEIVRRKGFFRPVVVFDSAAAARAALANHKTELGTGAYVRPRLTFCVDPNPIPQPATVPVFQCSSTSTG